MPRQQTHRDMPWPPPYQLKISATVWSRSRAATVVDWFVVRLQFGNSLGMQKDSPQKQWQLAWKERVATTKPWWQNMPHTANSQRYALTPLQAQDECLSSVKSCSGWWSVCWLISSVQNANEQAKSSRQTKKDQTTTAKARIGQKRGQTTTAKARMRLNWPKIGKWWAKMAGESCLASKWGSCLASTCSCKYIYNNIHINMQYMNITNISMNIRLPRLPARARSQARARLSHERVRARLSREQIANQQDSIPNNLPRVTVALGTKSTYERTPVQNVPNFGELAKRKSLKSSSFSHM